MTASLETLDVAAYIFADGVVIPRPGPADADYQRQMELISIELITPEKHKLGQPPPLEIAKSACPTGDRVRLRQPQTADTAQPSISRKHPPGSRNGSRSDSSP